MRDGDAEVGWFRNPGSGEREHARIAGGAALCGAEVAPGAEEVRDALSDACADCKVPPEYLGRYARSLYAEGLDHDRVTEALSKVCPTFRDVLAEYYVHLDGVDAADALNRGARDWVGVPENPIRRWALRPNYGVVVVTTVGSS
jgi:hypothetical protein